MAKVHDKDDMASVSEAIALSDKLLQKSTVRDREIRNKFSSLMGVAISGALDNPDRLQKTRGFSAQERIKEAFQHADFQNTPGLALWNVYKGYKLAVDDLISKQPAKDKLDGNKHVSPALELSVGGKFVALSQKDRLADPKMTNAAKALAYANGHIDALYGSQSKKGAEAKALMVQHIAKVLDSGKSIAAPKVAREQARDVEPEKVKADRSR